MDPYQHSQEHVYNHVTPSRFNSSSTIPNEFSGPLLYVDKSPRRTARLYDEPPRFNPIQRYGPAIRDARTYSSATPQQQNFKAIGYNVVSDVPTLTAAEHRFLESVDVTEPLLTNIRKAFKQDKLDFGKIGVVLMKYRLNGRLEMAAYEECTKALSHYGDIAALPVSDIGFISAVPLQLSIFFQTHLSAQNAKEIRVKEANIDHLTYRPAFKFVSKRFSGSFPFKTNVNVNLQLRGKVPTDTLRCLAFVIRHTLAQIFDDKNAHKSFAYRLDGKNAKKNHQNLPPEAASFVIEYCLESFGFPNGIKYPSYDIDLLSIEYPSIADRLGDTRAEREANFGKLISDVCTFTVIIEEKLQRILCDIRTSVLKPKKMVINGQESNAAHFQPEKSAKENSLDKESDLPSASSSRSSRESSEEKPHA